jgi:hypothetical protein
MVLLFRFQEIAPPVKDRYRFQGLTKNPDKDLVRNKG